MSDRILSSVGSVSVSSAVEVVSGATALSDWTPPVTTIGVCKYSRFTVSAIS